MPNNGHPRRVFK
uniref:Uncharacterized protein n=1 Tax=Anguilla anguilla TaxID=7936 RepID=A0A0E9VXJ8_ANGAN